MENISKCYQAFSAGCSEEVSENCHHVMCSNSGASESQLRVRTSHKHVTVTITHSLRCLLLSMVVTNQFAQPAGSFCSCNSSILSLEGFRSLSVLKTGTGIKRKQIMRFNQANNVYHRYSHPATSALASECVRMTSYAIFKN